VFVPGPATGGKGVFPGPGDPLASTKIDASNPSSSAGVGSPAVFSSGDFKNNCNVQCADARIDGMPSTSPNSGQSPAVFSSGDFKNNCNVQCADQNTYNPYASGDTSQFSGDNYKTSTPFESGYPQTNEAQNAGTGLQPGTTGGTPDQVYGAFGGTKGTPVDTGSGTNLPPVQGLETTTGGGYDPNAAGGTSQYSGANYQSSTPYESGYPTETQSFDTGTTSFGADVGTGLSSDSG
jgi:hypothetical protein